MNHLIQRTLIGLIVILPLQSASAQYREFTNSKGQSINAMPLKKVDDGIMVKTDAGKKIMLKYAVLSQDDTEFIKSWTRPEFNHQIKSGGPKRNTVTQAEDCAVVINKRNSETDPFVVASTFKAKTEREIELALEMFTGILRHKENFLEKNAVLGKIYRISLTQFSKKFKDGLSWSISANDEHLTLSGSGNGEYITASEGEAEYLLNYLKDIDADRLVKEFLRIQNRN
jgi:hypothetical protein